MHEKLDKQLCDTYPALYRQRNLTMQQTCMCWGFACGAGWYKIIDALSKKLTDYATANKITIEAAQVKEKFGTLSFYLDSVPEGHYDAVYAIVREAEAASAVTCEMCGEPGKLRGGGWIRTLCNACEASKVAGVPMREDK
jgi:hypothetical protein